MHGQQRYFQGLDGVRALAILAVVGFHADLVFLPGGFIGVEVFFVLSGFLVTGALFTELKQCSRIDVLRYAQRRLRRLGPALALMLLVVSAVVLVGFPDETRHLQRGVAGALTGTSNWAELILGGDYFAAFGRGPVLRHLWSFAVEVQAYVLLPFILTVLWKMTKQRAGRVAGWSFGLAAGCYGWQYFVAARYPDSSRAYFGTDTRFGAILLGAGLAVAVTGTPALSARWRVLLPGSGFLALGALGWVCANLQGTDPWVYRGGLAVVGLLTCVLIGSIVSVQFCSKSNALNVVLGCSPLRWLGTRSYGVYLWHWPIFVLSRPVMGEPLPLVPLLARLAITCLVAEGSFRFVESRSERCPIQIRHRSVRRVGELVFALIVGTLISGVATASPIATAPAWQVSIEPVPVATTTPTTTPTTPTISGPTSTVPVSPSGVELPLTVPLRRITGSEITLIGDSVMLAAEPTLRSRLGAEVIVDARVGRQFKEGKSRVEALRVAGNLRAVVVVGLGTNGPFSGEEIDQLISALSDRELLVFVLVKAPRRWEKNVNATLHAAQQRHPGIVLVDWPSLVKSQRLRLPDGVHPTPKSAAAYADSILDSINATQRLRIEPIPPTIPPTIPTTILPTIPVASSVPNGNIVRNQAVIR
jgi:peptidoglycan/LPS O-acetylase OafA/YrhL